MELYAGSFEGIRKKSTRGMHPKVRVHLNFPRRYPDLRVSMLVFAYYRCHSTSPRSESKTA